MYFTEEDLRKAFEAGIKRGAFLERDEFAPFEKAPDDEYEYIESLKPKPSIEEVVPVTFGMLKRKIYWDELHEIIGVGYYAIKEGFVIEESEVFQIPVSVAEAYNLI